jgi:predicted flap endonuclease-1-like 5' DNA nuclease
MSAPNLQYFLPGPIAALAAPILGPNTPLPSATPSQMRSAAKAAKHDAKVAAKALKKAAKYAAANPAPVQPASAPSDLPVVDGGGAPAPVAVATSPTAATGFTTAQMIGAAVVLALVVFFF